MRSLTPATIAKGLQDHEVALVSHLPDVKRLSRGECGRRRRPRHVQKLPRAREDVRITIVLEMVMCRVEMAKVVVLGSGCRRCSPTVVLE